MSKPLNRKCDNLLDIIESITKTTCSNQIKSHTNPRRAPQTEKKQQQSLWWISLSSRNWKGVEHTSRKPATIKHSDRQPISSKRVYHALKNIVKIQNKARIKPIDAMIVKKLQLRWEGPKNGEMINRKTQRFK
jgi:hypothetical protein